MSTRIGIVFDFDDTLAPDSTSGFLESIGVDADHFWSQRVHPLVAEDWDPIPAYLHVLLEESQSREAGSRITRDSMRAWGERIELFPGVSQLFGSLRGAAHMIDPAINVEFYLISSGLGDVLRACPIAHEFHDIWACEFATNAREEIVFPKNIVSFTEKTRFMYKVSKGQIGPSARGNPFAVNERVRTFRIPFSQMIFVGDGHTDVPCFALLKSYGGTPLGVYRPMSAEHRSRAWSFVKNNRVAGLYQARFEPESDLHHAMLAAVEDTARRIATAATV